MNTAVNNKSFDDGPLASEAVLEEILFAMVDRPEDVEVVVTVFKDTSHELPTKKLTIKAHADDLGKIIGKQGAMTDALRRIIGTVGSKEKFWVQLDVDTSNGTAGHYAAQHGYRAPQPQQVAYFPQPPARVYGHRNFMSQVVTTRR